MKRPARQGIETSCGRSLSTTAIGVVLFLTLGMARGDGRRAGAVGWSLCAKCSAARFRARLRCGCLRHAAPGV